MSNMWGVRPRKNKEKPLNEASNISEYTVVTDEEVTVEVEDTSIDNQNDTSISNVKKKKFSILSEKDLKEYRSKFIKLPPTKYLSEKIVTGLEAGIPMEYFVDQKIITSENLYTIDFDLDMLQDFLDYINFKEGTNVEIKEAPETIIETESFAEPKVSYEHQTPKGIQKITGEGKISENLRISIGKPVKEKTRENFNIGVVEEILEESIEVSEDNIEEIENFDAFKEELTKESDKEYEKIKSELNVLDEKVTNSTKIYSQDDVDIIKTELGVAFDKKLDITEKSYKQIIKELENTINIKDSQITTTENKLQITMDTNNNSLTRLSELRKELIQLKEDIRDLNNTIFKLNQIKSRYELIKDKYVVYEEYYKTQAELMERTLALHDEKVKELQNTIARVEKERNDIQEVFNEFYTNSGSIAMNISSTTTIQTIYFKILGVPKHFYSMARHLESIIRSRKKNLLVIAFDHENIYTEKEYEGWINLKNAHSVDDVKNYGDRIVSDSMDRVMAAKLEAILTSYDIAIIYDFILDDKPLITSPLETKITVLKNSKQQKLMGISETNLLSDDHHEIINISYDEVMAKYTNERVKMSFYANRLRSWLDEVLNKTIEI